jgi:hypothetical protein
MNNLHRSRPLVGSTLALLLLAASFCVCSSAHAVFLRGQPFTPTGANFSIFAAQGIDNSNPTGQSGFNPQVNGDFEFKDSIGVSYDDGSGHLTDFGVGLYNAAGAVKSTGLNVQYNTLVDANSITITIEDFDIHAGKDTFFNPHKVEPVITIFGANHSVIATAQPTDIFSLLVPNNTAGGKGSTDVWDLNIGAVLNSLHISDTTITGFLLSADMSHGEIPNSDPYLLVAIGRGTPVPEMGTLFPVIGLLVAVLSTQVLRRRKVQQLAALQISSQ